MNLQENISRIKKVMGLISETTRPTEEEFKQALADIKPLIPELTHRIIHKGNLDHNTETIVRINRELFTRVKSGDDKILDDLWEIAGTLILKNAINIITFYTK